MINLVFNILFFANPGIASAMNSSINGLHGMLDAPGQNQNLVIWNYEGSHPETEQAQHL